MRRTGTDLMATGVIVGSTALAVAATLAFTRATPMETQDSMVKCSPHDAHWSVMYAVTVDGDAVKRKPVNWRFHTRFHGPRESHEAIHRCRHLTLVAPQATLTANRLIVEPGEAADQVGEAADRVTAAADRAESAKEQAEALRKRLEAIRELAKQQRKLREAVAKKIEADRARER